MNQGNFQTIEQGRAKFAYDQVKEIADLDPDAAGLDGREATRRRNRQKKYKTSAKKLPVLIKTNGLGQALAYIQTRDDTLYQQLARWLGDKGLIERNDDLVRAVINMKSDMYRRVTTETLALLNWVRRFVDGLMPKVEEDNDSPTDDVEEDNV